MNSTFPWIITFIVFFIFSCQTESPDNSNVENQSVPLILSVNAYSFSDLLMARDDRNNEQVYTLFNLLDWCASREIKALDPTAYFFPTYPDVPSDEYLEKFKNYAAELGIAISGTGIRNDFASPDPMIRKEGVERAKNWIVAASKMGAPVIRVFAGEIPEGYEDNWEEPAQWMIECYKELIPDAQKYGVKIGIQNHGDMLQTAGQCIYVLEAINSDWVGLIVDTGNFKTADPYDDIAAVIPYTLNWQVKESPFGLGGEERTDFVKLVRIIKEGGYTGYLPVETLMVRGVSYDPFALVSEMIAELEVAIDSVYAPSGKQYASTAFINKNGTPVEHIIPGKLQCEFFDSGGEGHGFHDNDSLNSGSGGLNKGTDYYNTFRINEFVDISFTKHYDSIDNSKYNIVQQNARQLYVGWTEPGEWMKYSVYVEESGTYQVGLMFTARYDGVIRLATENNAEIVDLIIPSTYNAEDPFDWRQWHHWNYIENLGTIELKKGTQVLTIITLEKGEMNYDFMNFKLL